MLPTEKFAIRRLGRGLVVPISLLGALCLPLTAARGVVITSGTYIGGSGSDSTTGTNSTAIGGIGGVGYQFDVNNSPAVVSGGTFTGGNGGTASGELFDYGGEGGDAVVVVNPNNKAQSLSISGGSFSGGSGGGASGDIATAGSGGDAIDLNDDGAATISGGIFTGGAAGASGTASSAGYDFEADDGGVLTLIGTFTNAPGSPITGNGTGTITGMLANNSIAATYSYLVSGGGSIILLPPSALPEPASLAVLGTAAASFFRRRRPQP